MEDSIVHHTLEPGTAPYPTKRQRLHLYAQTILNCKSFIETGVKIGEENSVRAFQLVEASGIRVFGSVECLSAETFQIKRLQRLCLHPSSVTSKTAKTLPG